MKFDIIGAGIGGLTTAIALKQKGIKFQLFEEAKEIKSVGAGIIIANNAMQVYEKLGLRDIIEENGNPITTMNITETTLNPISRIDLKYFEEKHKVKNIAIHRGVLQQILLDELGSDKVHLNHELVSVSENEKGYTLNFKNADYQQSSLLIGADGLNSVVRKALFPNTTIRNAKQVCWRGVTDFKLPIAYRNELNEAWGKEERFGFVQIAKNKVYWYALKSFKKNMNDFSIENIEAYFSEYKPIISDIIIATPKKHINTAEILDLKPTDVWCTNNVCLIGDAAHATTPNMGQGACQAIEDAYVLAECLCKYEPNVAFKEFQKLRLPKAHQVVKASWMMGKMAHISNPVLIEIRNRVMRMIPSSVNRKQSERIFQLPNI